MKRLICVVLLLVGGIQFAFAQTDQDYNMVCDSVVFDEKGKKLIMYEVAVFEDSNLCVKGAEKVVLDKASNEVVITNPTQFTFDGKINVNQGEITKIRYKLGDEVAYLE